MQSLKHIPIIALLCHLFLLHIYDHEMYYALYVSCYYSIKYNIILVISRPYLEHDSQYCQTILDRKSLADITVFCRHVHQMHLKEIYTLESMI